MTTTDLDAELNATELDPKVKIEPERDRWGRYVMPDPETGELKPWVRASTISRGLADTTSLDKWMRNNLVYGLGKREDLYAMAASLASPNEKVMIDQIIDAAYEAAESTRGANLGNALHRFTERIDDGEPNVEVPKKWRADVDAYIKTMNEHGVRVIERFTERQLLNTLIESGGTCDRILDRPDWKKPRVGDLKTGKNVVSKMDEIAGQMAIYANATHWYDPLTKTLHEMPDVDKEVAIVMHLPVGQGHCVLYEVDIAAGWQAVQYEINQRYYRKRKDLCIPLSKWEPKTATPKAASEPVEDMLADVGTPKTPASVDSSADTDAELLAKRIAWVTARAKAIATQGEQRELAEIWAAVCPEIPTFKKGGPTTHEQIDKLAGVCHLTEMVQSLQDFEPDPDPQRRARMERKKNNKWCEHGIPTHEQCPQCLGLPEGWKPRIKNNKGEMSK
jgi:hypothetical protein